MSSVISALIGALVSLVIATLLVQDKLGQTATDSDLDQLTARIVALEVQASRNTERIDQLIQQQALIITRLHQLEGDSVLP